jgi:hypothetical protein
LGLEITRTKKAWELHGIDDKTVKTFSRRTQQVEAIAKEEGITDAREKSELGARTRESKAEGLSFPQLQQLWRKSLDADQRKSIETLSAAIGSPALPEPPTFDRQAIEHASRHCFERNSVAPERTLLAQALRFGVGRTSAQQVLDTYAKSGFITGDRGGRGVVATREVFAEEQRMLNFARSGRGRCDPLGKGNEHNILATHLNKDRRAAVRYVLESPDAVMLIRGGAGVGKTTMMVEAVRAIEAAGTNVFTFAPSIDASRTPCASPALRPLKPSPCS